jgi:Flp pilus assembly pilin Flp
MMKYLKNEQGIALVTSLLLTLIALAMIMTMLYMITWQTKLSGANKRYKSALEASQGGAEIFAKQVIPYVFTNRTTSGFSFPGTGIAFSAGSSPCFNYKLNNPTATWGTKCSPDTSPFDPTYKPDITLTLQGSQANQNYNVYSKIVDTVPGNSDASGYELLDSGSGVAGMASGVAPKHTPALYRIEVQGQKATDPLEKSKLSVLYAY